MQPLVPPIEITEHEVFRLNSEESKYQRRLNNKLRLVDELMKFVGEKLKKGVRIKSVRTKDIIYDRVYLLYPERKLLIGKEEEIDGLKFKYNEEGLLYKLEINSRITKLDLRKYHCTKTVKVHQNAKETFEFLVPEGTEIIFSGAVIHNFHESFKKVNFKHFTFLGHHERNFDELGVYIVPERTNLNFNIRKPYAVNFTKHEVNIDYLKQVGTGYSLTFNPDNQKYKYESTEKLSVYNKYITGIIPDDGHIKTLTFCNNIDRLNEYNFDNFTIDKFEYSHVGIDEGTVVLSKLPVADTYIIKSNKVLLDREARTIQIDSKSSVGMDKIENFTRSCTIEVLPTRKLIIGGYTFEFEDKSILKKSARSVIR